MDMKCKNLKKCSAFGLKLSVVLGALGTITWSSVEINRHIHYAAFSDAECRTHNATASFDTKYGFAHYANIDTVAELQSGELNVRVHYPPSWWAATKAQTHRFAEDFTSGGPSLCLVSRAITNYKNSGRHEAVQHQVGIAAPAVILALSVLGILGGGVYLFIRAKSSSNRSTEHYQTLNSDAVPLDETAHEDK